jgi:hypothetical protein
VWFGWVLVTLGIGILLILKESSPTAELIFLWMIVGLGLGLLFTGLLYGIQASVRPEDHASCGAMFTLLRLFGQTLGVAIGGVIFQNQVRHRLEESSLLASQATDLAQRVLDLVEVIHQTPDGSPEKSELIDAFQGAFHTFVYVMCAMAAVGLALSLMIKGYSVDQKHVTDQSFQDSAFNKPPLGKSNSADDSALKERPA